MELRRLGADVRIYYLTRFRAKEVIHDFARPLLVVSHGSPYIAAWPVLRDALAVAIRRPVRLARLIFTLCRAHWRSPALLAKSMVLLPKCLHFAAELKSWGASHVHASFAGHPATAAWIINRVNGTPFSISCHGHDIFRNQSMLAEKFGVASFVRAISEFNANFLRQKLGEGPCRRLVVLHCGVETANVDRRPEPPPGGFRILFVGSLQPRKGVEVLLRALATLSSEIPWTCRIAGDGALRQPLETLTAELGIGNRVDFLGNQTVEQVSGLYAESSLLVVPSVPGPGGRAEGIPTVIMEALNLGCPVVASRLTGIPELVKDSISGLLFEPGDSQELATHIASLATNSTMAKELAERGRKLVAEEFALAKNVRRLFELMSMQPVEGIENGTGRPM